MTRLLGFIVVGALWATSSCVDLTSVRSCTQGHYVSVGNFAANSPMKMVLYPGDTTTLSASYNTGDGVTLGENCSSLVYTAATQPGSFTWTSSDTSVFAVVSGHVEARDFGTAELRVTSQGEERIATITVAPAVSSIRITATPLTPKVGDFVTVVIEPLDEAGQSVPNALLTMPALMQPPAAWPLWTESSPYGGRFKVTNQTEWRVWSTAVHSVGPLVQKLIIIKPQ